MALFDNAPGRPAQSAKGDPPDAVSREKLQRVAADIRSPVRSIRWGLLLLALGFFGFMIWALVAPLDEGVPAPGTVVVDTKRKTVQHLTGGIVREILVREAQHVKTGDVVIRLDDGMARANYQAARQQYFALRGLEGRLVAEQKSAAAIQFHPDLQSAGGDSAAVEHMNMQRQLFASRRAALQGEQAILAQSLDAMRESMPGAKAQLESKQAQLKLVREQLVGTRELAKDGYLPRNRWYEEERLAADLAGSAGDITASIARIQSNIAELEMRVLQRKREFQRDVEAQLADTMREAQVAGERMRAAQEELARLEIRAPADGMVVGLAAHTVGGVVAPGARLMDVVPLDSLLTLDVRVEPQLIDRIRADLPADIRIQAFLDNPNLMIEGRVLSVSADLVVEQANVPPFYLARIGVTPAGMKELGRRQLQPGMQAEVVIKTGERTLMTYLLRPLIQRLATAMRES